MDMEQRDYDSRTALHVAAAEGKNNLNNTQRNTTSWLAQVLRACFNVAKFKGVKSFRTFLSVMLIVCVSGHAEVVRFLLEACKVNPVPRDR